MQFKQNNNKKTEEAKKKHTEKSAINKITLLFCSPSIAKSKQLLTPTWCTFFLGSTVSFIHAIISAIQTYLHVGGRGCFRCLFFFFSLNKLMRGEILCRTNQVWISKRSWLSIEGAHIYPLFCFSTHTNILVTWFIRTTLIFI